MGLKSYAVGRSAERHPNKASAFADEEKDTDVFFSFSTKVESGRLRPTA